MNPLSHLSPRDLLKDSSRPAATAFTLIELLTAMAVLALLLVMLVQVINGILQATRGQSQQMESVAAARRAIDVMAADLQSAVLGQDVTILAPNANTSTNIFALLSSRRGARTAGLTRFLAVQYSTNANNELIRSYRSLDFFPIDLLAAAVAPVPNTPNAFTLAKGVLAVRVNALVGSNSFPLTGPAVAPWSTTNFNGVNVPSAYKAIVTETTALSTLLTSTNNLSRANLTRGMQIWIATMDDKSYELLKDTGNLAAAQSIGTNDPVAWRSAIDNLAIPASAKAGVRILNKTISLQ